MSYKEFLVQYSWAIQVAGVVIFGWFATWIASRSKPKISEGWVYAGYTLPVKVISAAFAAFMIAALWHNGMALFKESWWVPPAFMAVLAGSFWLAYEVFFTTLRWNEEALELHRAFLPLKVILIRALSIYSGSYPAAVK